MWFKNLTGFDEVSPEFVRENISINGDRIFSKVNGKSYQFGRLEVSTLQMLKSKVPDFNNLDGLLSVKQIIGDVQKMHCQIENRNALFQAASQFNLLEMVGPEISPERGIAIYENDFTQGPACAIACGAGTIYRNYFVPINGQIGQSRNNQIDCLVLIGNELDNYENRLWSMVNGYVLPNKEGLLAINEKLDKLSLNEYEDLKNKLKIGIQWESEVTISEQKNVVSQAYCSALPVAYCNFDYTYWEKFARLVLEATYEATLYAGLINYQINGSKKVFLTLVGGGAFGNEFKWISESIEQALIKFKNAPLEISIVSYESFDIRIKQMIDKMN